MALERTFSIIKPDAVAKNVIGAIYNRFESAGLRIVASKMIHMSKEQAEGFYAEHKERPFFKDLVGFMTSGPVMGQPVQPLPVHSSTTSEAAALVEVGGDVIVGEKGGFNFRPGDVVAG